MLIGLIKEGKIPPDKRVVLSPEQCAVLKEKNSALDVIVQSSEIRCFSDENYLQKNICIENNLSNCDVILGVKEVPIDQLIEGKTYFFFSHTIKKQPYNRKLLKAILEKKIRLIDYECLKNEEGKRNIGFGKYAGIVGAYNGLLEYGKRNKTYDLKPAFLCADMNEIGAQLKKVKLKNIKIVLTGDGRVSHGVKEIFQHLKLTEVKPEEFLNTSFPYPVFTNVLAQHYIASKDGSTFDKKNYYKNPGAYKSILSKYVHPSEMLFTGHVWNLGNPVLLSNEDLASSNNKCKVIADISCDIGGPLACTIRSTKIGDASYYYDPILSREVSEPSASSITVMAVDNLPCELPKDASVDFGNQFIENILPELGKADSEMLKNATIAENGQLTTPYLYLKDYVEGN